MTIPEHDRLCLISGGGASAELMACALANHGIASRLIAPQATPMPAAADTQARTIAIWQAGLHILRDIFGNEDFLQTGYPIRAMTLIDENARESHFLPTDGGIEQAYFGYNLPLNTLTQLAYQQNDLSDHVQRIAGITEHWVSAGKLRTSQGEDLAGELVIVAEGKDSPTAQAAGITPLRFSNGTVAIIAAVRHQHDHQGGTREYHRTPGPLAFVPLDAHHSSIVWIRKPNAETTELLQNADMFLTQLNADSFDQLGVESITAPAKIIPLTSRQSPTLRARRMALIGESAHKMPPTGAQGLNLTLRDIQLLQQLLSKAHAEGTDFGADRLLHHYAKGRIADTLGVSAAVHMANASIRLGGPLAAIRRGLQHQVLPHFPSLQRRLIRTALFGIP